MACRVTSTTRTPWAALLCAVVVAATLSCSRPAEIRYEAELDQASEASAHAVHEVRLSEVMRGLDLLRRERLPKAIDPAEAEARQAREVARVARAMAESARRISSAAPADLDADERAEFEALAVHLAELCDSLASEVATLDNGSRHARFAEIDATCADCHDRFRIPAD